MRALVVVCLLAPVWAQTGSNLLTSEDLIKDWENSKKFTIEVAAKMPADKYGFKATEAEMSFGALMVHIAGSQSFRFAQVSGTKPPPQLAAPTTGKVSKDQILGMLADSFDYVIRVLPKLTPEQLERSYKVDWRERPEASGRQVILNMFVHTAHHRAQAEVYLRLNGIEPPFYLF